MAREQHTATNTKYLSVHEAEIILYNGKHLSGITSKSNNVDDFPPGGDNDVFYMKWRYSVRNTQDYLLKLFF